MNITIFPGADLSKFGKDKASERTKTGELVSINTKDDFFSLITENSWSPSIFIDNIRSNSNFIRADLMVFDIDEKLSLRETIERIKLSGFTCIIGISTNHQKEKSGVIADRYRVILPLQNPILSQEDFSATWFSIAGDEKGFLFGADKKCKDPARFYFPCLKASFIEGYRKLEPFKFIKEEEKSTNNDETVIIEGKGELSNRTKKFMNCEIEKGNRHYEFVLAVLDLKAQQYTKEEVLDIMIPLMKIIKPEENVSYQVDHLFSKSKIEFDYRRKDGTV